jgi:hypothetical protein
MDKLQSVILTFDDETTAIFTGKAIFFPGDIEKRVVKIEFSIPRDLPKDTNWEEFPSECE